MYRGCVRAFGASRCQKSAPDACSSGARDASPNYFRLIAGSDFEQVIFAVLLRDEKPRPILFEYFGPD